MCEFMSDSSCGTGGICNATTNICTCLDGYTGTGDLVPHHINNCNNSTRLIQTLWAMSTIFSGFISLLMFYILLSFARFLDLFNLKRKPAREITHREKSLSRKVVKRDFKNLFPQFLSGLANFVLSYYKWTHPDATIGEDIIASQLSVGYSAVFYTMFVYPTGKMLARAGIKVSLTDRPRHEADLDQYEFYGRGCLAIGLTILTLSINIKFLIGEEYAHLILPLWAFSVFILNTVFALLLIKLSRGQVRNLTHVNTVMKSSLSAEKFDVWFPQNPDKCQRMESARILNGLQKQVRFFKNLNLVLFLTGISNALLMCMLSFSPYVATLAPSAYPIIHVSSYTISLLVVIQWIIKTKSRGSSILPTH